MARPSPIPIYVSNNQGLIWTVDDVAALRSAHHICGSGLLGTLPSAAQQNVFLGLPLLLMPEEVVLLVENELAYLTADIPAHPLPTPAQLAAWHETQRADVARQQRERTARESRSRPAEGALGEQALARRAERERRRRERERERERAAAAGGEGEGDGEEEIFRPEAPPSLAAAPPPPASPTPTASHWLTIPTSSTPLPWYAPAPHTHATLASAALARLWTYPGTPHERAKCRVFRSLWEQGYVLGPGLKFGGDWLVYPGDPLRYHSHFVATALDGPEAAVSPMQVIAFGRLGTATRKAHLLCAWDEQKGRVDYFSIEWANFG